jgi:zinc protease
MRRVAATFLAAAIAALAADASQAADVRQLDAVRGATTWFVEDHSVPMIAMAASLPAGSAYDPANKAGLSAFAAAMIDEGAGGLDSRAFHDALANRAIQLSVTPDRDYLEISLVTLTENAADAFRLLSLALQHPRFDQDAIARVRAQMIQNVQRDEEDPEAVAEKGFHAAFFTGHAYGHSPDGDIPGLSAVTQEDLKGFARGHWVRGGMKIAVAGDISPTAVAALLDGAFAKMSGAIPPHPPAVVRMGKAGVEIIPMSVPQPTAIFGVPAIPRNDPDYLPAYVANDILGGGGFSSRLTNEVRVKRGLTYGISTDLVTYRNASYMEGEVATRREDMHRSLAVTREVMKKFAEEGPTDQEVSDAKAYLTGSFPLTFASDEGLVSQLAVFQREGLGPDYVAKRNSLIDAVTVEDVRRVAKRLFDPKRLTIVVAGTPAGGHAPAGTKH